MDRLPNSVAATAADWLQQHPGVEVLARDRVSAYADNLHRAGPRMVQVADRWHLLYNVSPLSAPMLYRHCGELSCVMQDIVSKATVEAPPTQPHPPIKA